MTAGRRRYRGLTELLLATAVAGTVFAVATALLAPMAGRVARYALAGASAAPVPPGWRPVSYQGVHLAVPASWPVVDLSAHPLICPRLDVHAVYLGTPGPHPRCPASGIGAKTEAVQIFPEVKDSPEAVGATKSITVGGVPALTSPAVGASHTITDVFPGARAQVELSYGTGQALITQVQATISVTASRTAGASFAGPRFQPVRQAALPLGQAQGWVKGYGFDTCSAPSSGTMRAWLSSPYRSIGVYIGGADEACAQPNLTASWISTVEHEGWHVFPLYVGPQAPCVNAPGNLTFSASGAASAGSAAAADAARQARNLGLPASTPVIYDMEGYSGCGSAVTTFVNSWDRELRAKGYGAGVYESASNIPDLVGARSRITEPGTIFYADWDGQATTQSPYMPSTLWTNHQRIHQYIGNAYQVYGGIGLGIDEDRLNVNLGGGGRTAHGKPQTAVVDSRGTVRVYARPGNGGALWEDHLNGSRGSAWTWFNMGGNFLSSPAAVRGTDGTTHVFAVGTGGKLWERHLPKGGSWSSWADLGGNWPSGIAALAQPSGMVRVYAIGTTGQLYEGRLTGGSWTGWYSLGGRLTGTPVAVTDTHGVVRVFARSGSGRLWEDSLPPPHGPWRWANLGGNWPWSPAALPQPSGTVRVYAIGTIGQLYEGRLTGGSWTGWYSLGGSHLTGTPAAVTDTHGVVRVFAHPSSGRMWEASLPPPHGPWRWTPMSGNWPHDPSAVVDARGTVRVYAVGTTGQVYENHLASGWTNWSGWWDMGGP